MNVTTTANVPTETAPKETAQKVNLFANKQVKKPAAAPKTEKDQATIESLEDKIQRFLQAKADLDSATGALKMLEGDIKAAGKEHYIRKYLTEKRRPESYKIADKTGSSCLLIVMDKYATVDENKAEVLRTHDLVEENIVFKMDSALVEMYSETLSDLIMNCPDIAEEHKAALIYGEVTFSVKKGAIERLCQYQDAEQIFDLVSPQIQLKK